MAQMITLTKHPERQFGMGLSMSIGGSTPPTPTVKGVHIWTAASGETVDTFEDNNNTIPAGYYSGRTDILKVVVDYGVYTSEENFDGCTNLSSVTLNGRNIIRARCFRGCTSLSEVNIGNSYTRLEGWVFSGCTSLTSITLPENILLVGGWAFANCSNLEEVEFLREGSYQLNDGAFAGCISLDKITTHSELAPILNGNTVFSNVGSDGTVYAPTGGDYSVFMANLPANWTIVYT